MKNKAYKFRLYPNSSQKELIAKTFGSARFIYNKMLEDSINNYKKKGLNSTPSPASYKQEFEWLKEVDSLALASSWRNLRTAFNNFFKGQGKVGYPKFKSKHRSKKSYTTYNQKGTVRFEGNRIRLPKLGLVKVVAHREIPEDYILKSATISQDSVGDYFVSVMFEYESYVEDVEIESAIGLDYSMPELYVDHLGQSPNYPRYYRTTEEKLVKAQRKLSLRKNGSKNKEKQRTKVAKLYRKVANQRKDFLHKQSTWIANEYELVAVEDIDLRAMSQALNFGKSVSDNGFGFFREMLSYKLDDRGKAFVKIDRWFPSTKTCYACGNQQKLTLSDRTYKCINCMTESNRDTNAALNIRREGVKNRGTHGVSLRLLEELALIEQEAPAS